MWQVEDLIRANGCDMERIRKNIIEPYPATDEQKKELARWYEDLINMMQQEECWKRDTCRLTRTSLSG